jgi:cytochrome P450 RapN
MTTTEQGAPAYPFAVADRLELNPRYAQLRRDEPLIKVTMPFGGEAWLATRYADIKMVLADQRFSRALTLGTDTPRPTPQIQTSASILSMDPPEHTRLRKITAKAFTARRIGELRPRTQEIIDGLIDEMVAGGAPADLSAAVAWPLPITVICEMLGVPYADREQFRAWTDQVMALTEDTPDTIMGARDSLNEYLAGLVAERRANPTEDLLGVLVAARDEGERLSEEELVTFGVTLLVAGHETTANHTGNMVYTLLSQPDLWQQLVADPDLAPTVVEELMRYLPLGAAAGFPRIATEDIEVAGHTVRAGEAVVVQIAAANRDETVFDRPDEVRFDRGENPHVGFGHGVHHCLGAQLARMEMQLALGTLARRLPGLRLAVPADEVVWKTNRLIRGVRALPVAW